MISDDRLREMADELAAVPGVCAVALGGSRARGTHRPDSDVDLGLYYDDDFDLPALERLAARWTGEAVPVAGPGGWGPWVDGGAWLTVDGTAVDWILSDVARVGAQCERARRGEFAFHPQPGHPFGFLDVAYAGEVAMCVPLRDDDSVLVRWAESVTPYPEPLRAAMLHNLWQADFLLAGAEKGAGAADAVYVGLCAATAAMLIAHGWHAAAGQWVTNEKNLVPHVDRLPIETHGFGRLAASVLGDLGTTPERLHASLAALRGAPRPSA